MVQSLPWSTCMHVIFMTEPELWLVCEPPALRTTHRPADRQSGGSVGETREDCWRWFLASKYGRCGRLSRVQGNVAVPSFLHRGLWQPGSSSHLWAQLLRLHPGCLGASLGAVWGWVCPGSSSLSLARASIPCALRADPHVWTARCPPHLCACRKTCAAGSCGVMVWGWSLSPLISLGLNCKDLGICGGFPGSSAGKESTCNAGDPDSWVRKISWRRDRLATPVFLDFTSNSDDKESAYDAGDLGSVSRLGRSPGGGHGNPL